MNQPFSYLRASLGRLASQPHHILGVTLDDSNVHAVLTRHQKGQKVVEKVLTLSLPAGSTKEKAQALKEYWDREGVSFDEWVLTFPQREAIARILVLPATDPREIGEMVKLQATRQTPLGADEMAITHQVLEKTSTGYTRVLMVILRKDELRKHQTFFEEIGLSPNAVVLDTLVTLPLIRGTERSGHSLVVHVQNGSIDLGVFLVNQLFSVRSIGLSTNTLAEEIKRTVMSCPGEPHLQKDWMVSIAAPEQLTACIHDAVRQVLNGRIVSITSKERASLAPAVQSQEVNLPWGALAASLMDASERRSGLNLLTAESQKRKTRESHRRELGGTLVLSMLFAGSLTGAIGQNFHAKKVELARLTRECAAIAPRTQDLRRMELKLDTLRSRMNQPDSFLSALSEVNRLAPERISLQSVEFEQGRTLLLQGTCFSLSDAVKLVETLQKSPLFSVVELRSSNLQHFRDQEIGSFVISCSLASGSERRKGMRFHAKA